MTEEKYLEFILARLSDSIEELKSEVDLGDKDILGLQEFYWDNFSDFDEYGYEEYENRRQIIGEVNSKGNKIRDLHTFGRMMDSPYFARVNFIFEGEDEPEECYIGIGNFAPDKTGAPLIYDWRAPISSLFYDYDKGPAAYEAPMGTVKGVLAAKYQYKIKKGKLLYVIESDIKIDDDILKQALSMNADARLKSIVSTIQKEQNQIIRNEKDKLLIVQGGAGSGKTSIALHRIAYLLYHHRNEMVASQVLILSPNDVFSDYISHILPELGEENISEMTFDDFSARQLSGIGVFESHMDFLEDVLSHEDDEYAKMRQEKLRRHSSEEFVASVNAYVLSLEYELMNFKDVKFKKLEKKADDIATLFYDKLPDIPIFKRMDAVCEYVIDEYTTLTGHELDELELAIVTSKFEAMYETKDILKIYNGFLESIGEDDIDLEKRNVGYEDVYGLMYMKYLLEGAESTKRVKHLIIDEMQDYSYLQYKIISLLFKCPMTILGDKEQTIDADKSQVLDFLPKLFGREARKIVLNKSYRSTVEIASFAARIAGITDVEFFERHGMEPEYIDCSDAEMMCKEIKKNVDRQLSEGMETVAVLTKTQAEALALSKQLSCEVITKYTDRFKPGVVVAPFYLAKGLEFDGVHVAFADRTHFYSDYHRQIMYICATRALHELKIYGVGEAPEFI